MRASVHAWVIATGGTVNEWAQVIHAVGAVRVAKLCSGRLVALRDYPRCVPSKLSVHRYEGGVHTVAEQLRVRESEEEVDRRERRRALVDDNQCVDLHVAQRERGGLRHSETRAAPRMKA